MQNKSQSKGEMAFGFFLIALGLFMLIEAVHMPSGPAYAVVGPKSFPLLVSVGLLSIGLSMAWAAWRKKSQALDEQTQIHSHLNWPAVLQIGTALLIPFAALKWLGWILCASAVFSLVSRAFGSKRLMRDVAVGLGLAALSYFIFNKALGLELPLGQLFSFLPQG
jgi:putative tricarboxylic transport membrane protein